MNKSLLLTLVFLINFSLASNYEFSVMTLNAQNLFDTSDDPKKDDKAYLPIEKKQNNKHKRSCERIPVKSWKNECLFLDWDEETKNIKLKSLVKNITSYNKVGPDILGLQEIENINILSELFNLLKPYGYTDYVLLESDDYRGIDNAIVSKYKIVESSLHYIKFSGKFSDKDTRPILEAKIQIYDKNIRLYNVHFPSGFHDVSMRIDSLKTLNQLKENQSLPAIAIGDFNVNSKEDIKYKIYESQTDNWQVAHIEGCVECKGSFYYNYGKSWDFLDTIFISKENNIKYKEDSINVHRTFENSYSDTGKPIKFNAITRKGVSDHLPVVAEISLR